MNFRSPTAADIGKTVEVYAAGNWVPAKLTALRYFKDGAIASLAEYSSLFDISLVRVPYSTPDPIAELSMAADLLAERGADEASKILALFAAMDNSQRNHILRMIEEKDERLRPIEFRMMMRDYGNMHFDRRSLYRPST